MQEFEPAPNGGTQSFLPGTGRVLFAEKISRFRTLPICLLPPPRSPSNSNFLHPPSQFHSRLRRFRHALAPRGPLPGPHWESQLIWKLAPREAPSLDLIAELNTRLAATQDPDRHWSGLWIDEVPRVRGWAELFQLQLNVADILRDFDFNGRTKLVDIFVIAHKINTADDGEHNTMHISPRYILERKTAQVQLCRPAAPSVTKSYSSSSERARLTPCPESLAASEGLTPNQNFLHLRARFHSRLLSVSLSSDLSLYVRPSMSSLG